MIENGIIMDPLKEYTTVYQNTIVENATDLFESLASKSEVRESDNQIIIKKLKKAEEVLENHKKKANSIKGWRIFLTIVLVLCAIGSIFCIYNLVVDTVSMSRGGLIAGAISCILVFIGGIVLDIIFVKSKLKEANKLVDQAQGKVNAIQEEAYNQMRPLFSMFDWRQTLQLVEKTCPIIHLDEVFDARKLDFLVRNYGFQPVGYKDVDHSIVNVMSGTMNENPFIICKQLTHRMGTKTYTGTLLNTYTVWVGSGDDRHLETRTETLIATLTKPCPYYNQYNYIVYGNEAGDRLVFNRVPSGLNGNEKDAKIDKIVKKGAKKLDKLEHKALTDGDDRTNFTKMGNEKFDVLFGATDRNDEVQFRMLFSPAVQINMTKLITDGIYGDDFTFNKRCQINIIHSNHSQGFDYSCNYTNYVDIEYSECRRKFIEYNKNFFSCLYFDLAPLLAITLYQSTKPRMFTYKNMYERKYTSYEDESMANHMGYPTFGGAGFDTQAILKSKFIKSVGDTDYSLITSYSYTITHETEFVPTLGSDGDMHLVPVTYEIFTPISKDTVIGTSRYEGSEREYSALTQNKAFQDFLSRLGPVCSIIKNKGLVGFVVGDPTKAKTDTDLKSLYN